MKRDPHTIAHFIEDPLKKEARKNRGKIKASWLRGLSRITRQLKKIPNNIKKHQL